ncbi:MAG: hypothetical protein U1F43_03525 [Myxococcota bacterium]
MTPGAQLVPTRPLELPARPRPARLGGLLARSPRTVRAYRMAREHAAAYATYRAFKVALRPFLGRDPALAPRVVARTVRLRVELLRHLGLPTTLHNVDRLVMCAAAGLSLRAFLRDVDRHFYVRLGAAASATSGSTAHSDELPPGILAEEAIFMAAFAAHARARGLRTAHDRRYDAEAFLGLPHDGRSSPIVGAWLDGALSWTDLMVWARREPICA